MNIKQSVKWTVGSIGAVLVGLMLMNTTTSGALLFQKLTTWQPTNVCDPTTLTNCAPVSSSNGISANLVASALLPAALAADGGLKVTAATADSAAGANVSTTPVPVGCVKDDTPTQADADQDIAYIRCNLNGEIYLAPIPAGTNNIGDVDVLTVPSDPFGANADSASATGSISAKLRFIAATGIPITSIAAGNNNIGDVDIASMPALPTGTNTIGFVSQAAATSGGASIGSFLSDNTNTEVIIKASAGQLYGLTVTNKLAAPMYVRLYNLTDPDCTSATGIVGRWIVPAASDNSGGGFVQPIDIGAALSTGISLCLTTTVSDTNNTAIGTGNAAVTYLFK